MKSRPRFPTWTQTGTSTGERTLKRTERRTEEREDGWRRWTPRLLSAVWTDASQDCRSSNSARSCRKQRERRTTPLSAKAALVAVGNRPPHSRGGPLGPHSAFPVALRPFCAEQELKVGVLTCPGPRARTCTLLFSFPMIHLDLTEDLNAKIVQHLDEFCCVIVPGGVRVLISLAAADANFEPRV